MMLSDYNVLKADVNICVQTRLCLVIQMMTTIYQDFTYTEMTIASQISEVPMVVLCM